jgi:hypothetical protein
MPPRTITNSILARVRTLVQSSVSIFLGWHTAGRIISTVFSQVRGDIIALHTSLTCDTNEFALAILMIAHTYQTNLILNEVKPIFANNF